VAGFYRGVGSPLVALTVLNSCNFFFYNFFRDAIISKYQADNVARNIPHKIFPTSMVACIFVAPISSLISTPFELVKIQMQLDLRSSFTSVDRKKYKNSLDCCLKVLREFGYRGLYLGHTVNTLREMVFLSTYFTTYESVRRNDMLASTVPLWASIPLAGGIAGALGWFISFPLDCIKAHIQGADISVVASQRNRKSAFQIGKEMVKLRGLAGLYSGLLPSIIRAFVVSSSRFSAYELAKYWLDSAFDDDGQVH
jgi:solute carrier family 25 carnitine/acylcarnitine transporter 20/29